jgi:hypothetical protein
MLIATPQGGPGDNTNPRFHALNQAIVQLVIILPFTSEFFFFFEKKMLVDRGSSIGLVSSVGPDISRFTRDSCESYRLHIAVR